MWELQRYKVTLLVFLAHRISGLAWTYRATYVYGDSGVVPPCR